MTIEVTDDISKDSSKTEEETNELDTFNERVKTPREEAMERMVANSNDEREKSRQEFIDDQGFDPMDEELEELEEDEELEGEVLKEELDNPEESANNHIIERDGVQYIQLVVNGETKEMPVEAAKMALRKSENADQRLWEADQKKQEYDALIAQHDKSATLPDASDENAVDTQEALKEAFTKVYDGEVDEAAEVLGKVLRPNRKSEPVDVQAEVAKAIAVHDDHKALQSAYDSFISNDDFKVVTSDPVLLERVNAFTEDLQRDPEFLKTKPSYADFFEEAGNRAKVWLEKVSGTKLAPSSEKNIDSRLERKRHTPSQPTSRTVRRGPKPDAKANSKSRADVIREMAEKRGQTNL